MSPKKSKRVRAQPVKNVVTLNLADLMPDRIDAAIFRVTGPTECVGMALPPVYRAWMSHPAFQVA